MRGVVRQPHVVNLESQAGMVGIVLVSALGGLDAGALGGGGSEHQRQGGGNEAPDRTVLTALHMVNNSARCDRCVRRKAVCKFSASCVHGGSPSENRVFRLLPGSRSSPEPT